MKTSRQLLKPLLNLVHPQTELFVMPQINKTCKLEKAEMFGVINTYKVTFCYFILQTIATSNSHDVQWPPDPHLSPLRQNNSTRHDARSSAIFWHLRWIARVIRPFSKVEMNTLGIPNETDTIYQDGLSCQSV